MIEVTPPVKLYEMAVIKHVFIDAVKHVLSNLSDEQKIDTLTGLISMIGRWHNYLILSSDMLPKVSEEIFTNDNMRSFYLSLQYVFFTQVAGGFGTGFINTLITDLSISVSNDLGLSLDDTEQEDSLSAMPQAITDTLVSAKTANEVIRANPWIICVMLFLAFVNLDSDILKTTVEKSRSK